VPEFVDVYALSADQPEVARKLLAAAGDQPEVVRTVADGFRVPASVAEAAGYTPGSNEVVDAEARSGSALGNTALPTDVQAADILSGSAPESLPAKVDGGRQHLTDRPGGETPAAAENPTTDEVDGAAEGDAEGEKPAARRAARRTA
jgi:hypothetical protein